MWVKRHAHGFDPRDLAAASALVALPSAATREHKVWPFVGRVDSAYGDRNLVCTCVGMEAYE